MDKADVKAAAERLCKAVMKAMENDPETAEAVHEFCKMGMHPQISLVLEVFGVPITQEPEPKPAPKRRYNEQKFLKDIGIKIE